MSESEMALGAAHGALLEESPYGIQHKKLAIWLFITSDAVTFAAVLFVYGYLRVGSPDWTTPFDFSPTIMNGIIMTFVLLTSSLTMLAALRNARAGRKSSCLGWLGATIVLGILFAALHIREWLKMIGEGWRLFQNPTGGSVLFGATFFSVTGLHLLHVTAGVLVIAVIAIGYSRGRWGAGHVETTGLYWHFVDVVWMFVFPLVYLMNAK